MLLLCWGLFWVIVVVSTPFWLSVESFFGFCYFCLVSSLNKLFTRSCSSFCWVFLVCFRIFKSSSVSVVVALSFLIWIWFWLFGKRSRPGVLFRRGSTFCWGSDYFIWGVCFISGDFCLVWMFWVTAWVFNACLNKSVSFFSLEWRFWSKLSFEGV